MRQLSSTEEDRNFNFVASFEKLRDLAKFDLHIMLADLKA